MFGDPQFRRERGAPGINAALNYGYAVLRSLTARAICGAGLHPGLGIHHHNRYDPLCLVDDLMEPFRPLVDRLVATDASLFRSDGNDGDGLTRQGKVHLATILTSRLVIQGEVRRLPDVLARVAASLAESFETGRRVLVLPKTCI